MICVRKLAGEAEGERRKREWKEVLDFLFSTSFLLSVMLHIPPLDATVREEWDKLVHSNASFFLLHTSSLKRLSMRHAILEQPTTYAEYPNASNATLISMNT
jgi:hypothetical protein